MLTPGNRAVTMIRKGRSLTQVAELLNVPADQVVDLVEDEIQDTLQAQKSIAVLMELARLDVYLEGIADAAAKGDLPAIHAALKIQERRAKLLGLDAVVAPTVQINTQVNYKIDGVDLEKLK